jgi:hypothetical protein
MAMSAVKESPFFKNLICRSLECLPTAHCGALGKIICLNCVLANPNQ